MVAPLPTAIRGPWCHLQRGTPKAGVGALAHSARAGRGQRSTHLSLTSLRSLLEPHFLRKCTFSLEELKEEISQHPQDSLEGTGSQKTFSSLCCCIFLIFFNEFILMLNYPRNFIDLNAWRTRFVCLGN